MKLRKGLKWSDGTPFTMDDVRFAWEDINYNEEMSPIASLSVVYKDRITGNVPKFNVVDDHTWTLTYDNPSFILNEGVLNRGQICGFTSEPCWFSPAHYYKQFHPKYADATELQAMVTAAGFDGYKDLWKLKNDTQTNLDVPCLAAWCLKATSDTRTDATRNHYFFGVDPEGNQLPYADEVTQIKMESREVAVFRSMSGNQDASAQVFTSPELPLYKANEEEGGYRIYLWVSTGGSDDAISINQTFNDDTEMGRWIRTKDFRIALSLALDRVKINDLVFLSLGTPQNWVAHPQTPYYPGMDVAMKDAVRDVARASQILDGLGLVDTDGDGFRNRLDGTGNLVLHFGTGAPGGTQRNFEITELMAEQLNEVGLAVTFRPEPHHRNARANTAYFSQNPTLYQANPWAVFWGECCVLRPGNRMAPLIGKWFQTGGTEGMSPDVADPTYLPLAPTGNFPADPSGKIRELQDTWNQGVAYATYDPRRIEMGKSIFTTLAEDKFHIGTVAFTSNFRGIMLNRTNFNNVPALHIADMTGEHNETYYFVDGRDNLHNE
jgi:peptide/nickel transport system substrate-binding protein